MINPPKKVKKANQWIVTVYTKQEKGGDKFEQKWFNSQAEAIKFYKENK